MLTDDLLKVKKAQKELELLTNEKRNELLNNIAAALKENEKIILDANKLDIINAKEANLTSSMIERLTLTEDRINGLVESTESLITELKTYEKLQSDYEKYVSDNKIYKSVDVCIW